MKIAKTDEKHKNLKELARNREICRDFKHLRKLRKSENLLNLFMNLQMQISEVSKSDPAQY